jgi:hypothetical protein
MVVVSIGRMTPGMARPAEVGRIHYPGLYAGAHRPVTPARVAGPDEAAGLTPVGGQADR